MSARTPVYLRDYTIPDFLIDTVNLQFEIKDAWTRVKSELVVYANPSSPHKAEHLVLNGDELELIAVWLDGQRLGEADYHQDAHSLTLFNVPSRFTLEVETRLYPEKNTALSGLYQSNGNLCTQCEPHGFRRITYYLDRPDVMARFTTTLIADEKKYPVLLSNGNCIESRKEANGQHLMKWQDPFKKPCYLFALVAGDLDRMEDFFTTMSGRKISLHLYVEKGHLDKCAHAMAALKKAMRWDEERFGREYDLDIYMIVAVSDFNMGAMENKGLNIFNTQYILAKPETATDFDYLHIESVIAHEYCHNWSGNRITCRDWFQLSLKEGLTIFRDQGFTSDTTSKTVARINDVNYLRNVQFPEDAGPLAHPVQPDSYIEINNFYTATVYNKGAEVIRMQQTLLGETAFHLGMDYYFKEFDGQAVTIEEFVRSMETVSTQDLKQFRLWYKEVGTPNLTVTDAYDQVTQTYTLHIEQTSVEDPLHIPIKMGLLDQSGKEIKNALLELKKKVHTFHFKGITERPIPSLLREFSAPVKINYPYRDDELLFLFKNDTDLFNRWDAGQNYAMNLILRSIESYQQTQTIMIPDEYINALQSTLESLQQDKLLLAEMLTLPSEKYLSEQMQVIDVDAVHIVRETILQTIAERLQPFFINLYQENHSAHYSREFNLIDMGKRTLKNMALNYLTLLKDQSIPEPIILSQFQQALKSNMTDTMAALRCLLNSPFKEKDQVLNDFYQHWQGDALVIDKWFGLQAAAKLPDTLSKIKKLVEHPAFDLKNPNKVYSLIGTFGRNPMAFHVENGEGYAFLIECVLHLDALNPQIAARMLKPMSDWKRYDKKRKSHMQKQLEWLLTHKNLSNDVSEIAIKSLGV